MVEKGVEVEVEIVESTNTESGNTRIFCLPDATGDASWAKPLVKKLDYTAYLLSDSGSQVGFNKQPDKNTLFELALVYFAFINDVDVARDTYDENDPFIFVGYSGGGSMLRVMHDIALNPARYIKEYPDHKKTINQLKIVFKRTCPIYLDPVAPFQFQHIKSKDFATNLVEIIYNLCQYEGITANNVVKYDKDTGRIYPTTDGDENWIEYTSRIKQINYAKSHLTLIAPEQLMDQLGDTVDRARNRIKLFAYYYSAIIEFGSDCRARYKGIEKAPEGVMVVLETTMQFCNAGNSILGYTANNNDNYLLIKGCDHRHMFSNTKSLEMIADYLHTQIDSFLSKVNDDEKQSTSPKSPSSRRTSELLEDLNSNIPNIQVPLRNPDNSSQDISPTTSSCSAISEEDDVDSQVSPR